MTLIDPRQYTPYELIFPSGNINAVQGDDYFNIYLLNSLSGNFNITGGLSLNGQPVFAPGTTNNFGGTNSYVFGGTNNFVTGTNNSIIYAFSSEVSGEGSAILFGEQNQVVTGYYSSVLAGRNTLVSHTGAVVIGDSVLARQKNSVRNDSFNIDLTGGTFNQYELFQNGNFYLSSSASGLVSGNWNFDGNVYQTGSPLQNLQNLKDASGYLASTITLNSGVAQTGRNLLSGQIGSTGSNLFTSIQSTGSNLLNLIRVNSGISYTGLSTVTGFVDITGGSQTIQGAKTFASQTVFNTTTYFSGGQNILTSGARFGEKLGSDVNSTFYLAYGPTNYSGYFGGIIPAMSSKRGMTFVIDSFNQRDKNDRENQFTKNAFSIHSESMTNPSGGGKLCFGVDGSGLGYFRQGIIISNNRYVPSAYNSSGISGQMTWNPPYFYLCTGNNAWGRVAVAAW